MCACVRVCVRAMPVPGSEPEGFYKHYAIESGSDSSVGITTGYGLDCPGIESL